MSRRSLNKLFRQLFADKKNNKRSRPSLAVEQLEELALPSGVQMFPTYVLDSTFKSSSSGHGGITPQSGPASSSLSPTQIRTAYGINNISFNGVAGTGAGETIAIVDAYDDPSIASDLATFDTYYGLQTMNGGAGTPTFTKVSETGSTTSLPTANSGWAGEIELDVEWSHVVAPQANIVLVEASSASLSDLLTAVKYAGTSTGASVVSMSWGSSEFSGEQNDNSYFSQPGVTYFASSGDSGSPIIWPAISTDVIAAGGTTLTLNGSGGYSSEAGWSGSGGGLSQDFSAPSYQSGLVISDGSSTISAGGKRAGPDVAYDADPNSGVAVYGTYGFDGWAQVGGTSAASPQWAALVAIADQGRALAGEGSLTGSTQTLPALYALPSSDFHDVTTGSNGGYSAGTGFDLVTGRGSPVANLLVPALAGYSTGNAPTIKTPASATPSPVTGTTTTLSVAATANPTTDTLTYTWSLTGTPPASVNFSVNGTSASSSTVATFSKVGVYNFLVTVVDTTDGLSVTSSVSVTVNATVTSVTVSPTSASIYDAKTKQFTATAFDQFGTALATQPSFTWTVTGAGSVSSSGLYTAPASGSGTATVEATSGSHSGSASVSYSPAPAGPVIATPASANPNPVVTGTTTALTVSATGPTGDPLTYTWSLTGTPPASVTFSSNGTTTSNDVTATFTKAGSYTFLVTVTDTTDGLSTTSSVGVTVTATLTYVVVAPSSVTLAPSATQTFTATPEDQFHNTVSTTQTVTWSALSGTITQAGLYTAPSTGSSDTVTATIGGVSGTASVTITTASGVLFSDNFSKGAGNWTVDSGSYYLVSYRNGVNRLESVNYSGVNRIVAGSSTWTNYSYQAILTFTGQSYGSASLLARVVDDNHLYFFSYNVSVGAWQISAKEGANTTVVLATGPSYAAYYNTDYNVVANLNGSALSLYVDGVLEVSVTDSTYTSGKIGFSTTDATATIGNVVVTALSGSQVLRAATVSVGSSSSGTAASAGQQASGFGSAPPFTALFVSGYAPFGFSFSQGAGVSQSDAAANSGDLFLDLFGRF